MPKVFTLVGSNRREGRRYPTEISSGVPYNQEVQAMSENSRQSESHIDSIVRQEEEAKVQLRTSRRCGGRVRREPSLHCSSPGVVACVAAGE